jgi:hypothetical protein
MPIQALTGEFKRYFVQADHHDTVLWFDPDQEYVALFDHLTVIPPALLEASDLSRSMISP